MVNSIPLLVFSIITSVEVALKTMRWNEFGWGVEIPTKHTTMTL